MRDAARRRRACTSVHPVGRQLVRRCRSARPRRRRCRSRCARALPTQQRQRLRREQVVGVDEGQERPRASRNTGVAGRAEAAVLPGHDPQPRRRGRRTARRSRASRRESRRRRAAPRSRPKRLPEDAVQAVGEVRLDVVERDDHADLGGAQPPHQAAAGSRAGRQAGTSTAPVPGPTTEPGERGHARDMSRLARTHSMPRSRSTTRWAALPSCQGLYAALKLGQPVRPAAAEPRRRRAGARPPRRWSPTKRPGGGLLEGEQEAARAPRCSRPGRAPGTPSACPVWA